MDKELCFCIEGNQLYLEQVLVDYNDIPIFFLCKDSIAYYVVLCSDLEELSYIIVKASDMDIYRLLHGELYMREVFTKQKSYWEIISGENVETDLVTCKVVKEIDASVLPEEGACFEALTPEMLSYIKKFDDLFLSKGQFKGLPLKWNYDEEVLNEVYEKSFHLMKSFVELYNACIKQEIAVGFQNEDIGYAENLNGSLTPVTTITENEHSEEWKSTELTILAYAA